MKKLASKRKNIITVRGIKKRRIVGHENKVNNKSASIQLNYSHEITKILKDIRCIKDHVIDIKNTLRQNINP